MSSNVNNMYGSYVTNVANNSRETQKLADTFSKLLLNKPFAQLASAERSKVLMAVTAAQNSMGELIGQNPAQHVNTLFQGLSGISSGARVQVHGSAGSSVAYGASPVSMVAAGNMFGTMDRYLNGTGQIGSVGAASGLNASTAAGYLSQFMQARGGIRRGDMQQYNMATDIAGQFKVLETMQNKTNMTGAEIKQVYSDMLTTQMLNKEAQDKFSDRSYNDLSLKEQASVRQSLRMRYANMSEADKKKEQQVAMDNMAEQYRREIEDTMAKNADGSWKTGWHENRVKHEVDKRMRVVRKSGAEADISEAGVATAERTLAGRSSYSRTGKEFDEKVKSALANVDSTLAEMNEVFDTKNFDDMMEQARQFGVTTMANERDVKKMRVIMDAARARAASTGRTVQEVMQEYGQVASMGAQLYGGAQNMPASYMRQYNIMQASAQQNVASGFDTRTDEERLEAFNAQMANDAHYHSITAWALRHGVENGDERMIAWDQRVRQGSSGGEILTDQEYTRLQNEAMSYYRKNGSTEDKRSLNDNFARDPRANYLAQAAMLKRRTDTADTIADKITGDWLYNEDAVAHKAMIESDVFGATKTERRDKLKEMLKATVFEFGNNNAEASAFIKEGGEMEEGLARHNGDVDAYLKELTTQMQNEGRSKAAIANMESLVRGTHKMNGQQRRLFMEAVGGIQRDNRVSAGDAQLHDLQQKERAAEQQRALEASQGAVKRVASGDLATFLLRGQDSSAEGDLMAALFAMSDPSEASRMLADVEGNIMADGNAMNNIFLNSAEGLHKDLGFDKELAKVMMDTYAANTFTFAAGQNKGELSASAAISAASDLQKAITKAEEAVGSAGSEEEKAKAQEHLDVLLKRKGVLETATGMKLTDLTSEKNANMTDAEFTNRVDDAMAEAGMGTGGRDEKGNRVVYSSAEALREGTEYFKLRDAAKVFTHMEQIQGVDASTEEDAVNGKAEAIKSVLNAADKDEVLRRTLAAAEASGARIEATEKNENGEKVRTVSAGNDNITSHEDRLSYLAKEALSKANGAEELISAAKNGDDTARQILSRNLYDTMTGDGGIAFDHLTIAKSLGLEGDSLDAVRTDSKRRDALMEKAKAGQLSMKEQEELRDVQKRLDTATQNIRTTTDKNKLVKLADGSEVSIGELATEGEWTSWWGNSREEAVQNALMGRHDETSKDLYAEAERRAKEKEQAEKERNEMVKKALAFFEKFLTIKVEDNRLCVDD